MTIVFNKMLFLTHIYRKSANFQHGCRKLSTRLIELGKAEPSKTNEAYEIGQTFLHKLFGYRGIIVMQHKCEVNDMNKNKGKGPAKSEPLTLEYHTADQKEVSNIEAKEINAAKQKESTKPTKSTYYSVLMDVRDVQNSRLSAEHVSVWFDVPLRYMDYVSHEHIIPFKPVPTHTVQHADFNHFFYYDDHTGNFQPKEALELWTVSWFNFLNLETTFTRTTDGVKITVMPCFIYKQKEMPGDIYYWRYTICIESSLAEPITLREREWKIHTSNSGSYTKEKRGRGVIGEEPCLDKKSPAYQYSSPVLLDKDHGYMWGEYIFERGNETMRIPIPRFTLKLHKNSPKYGG